MQISIPEFKTQDDQYEFLWDIIDKVSEDEFSEIMHQLISNEKLLNIQRCLFND